MSSIFGPYLLGRARPYLNQLGRLQPRVALFMNPDRDDVREFKNVCPETVIVGRVYRPDSEVAEKIVINPEGAAAWAHNLIVNQPALDWVDYWHVENEVCQFWSQLPALNAYSLERMRIAHKYGYGCGVGVHSVGYLHMPPSNRMAYYEIMYPTMQEACQNGHVYLVHQYGWPDLWGPRELGGPDWLINRLEHQVLPRLPFAPPKFIVSEYGLDGLLVGPHPNGWSNVLSADQYAADLLNMGKYLEQWRGKVLGYCLYCLGNNNDWQWTSYNIAGDLLENLAAAQTAPPPPDEEEKPMEPVLVYDLHGELRNEEWLAAEYEGCQVLRAENVEPGAEVFRVIAIYVTEGPATIKAEVRNKEGRPQVGQPVAMTYPSLMTPEPGLPDLSSSGAKNLWSGRGAYQTTNSEGYTGFGLGTTYGPFYHTWVISMGAHADCVTGMGMKGMTNHRGPLHVVWQLMTEPDQDELLPEHEPATDAATLADKVRWWMEEMVRMREANRVGRADRIMYSLIKLDGGLLYRLENILKVKAAAQEAVIPVRGKPQG